MVKIFSAQIIVGLVLGIITFFYFSPKNYFKDCHLKVLTYSSFYEGGGKDIFKNYEKKFLCQLNIRVLKTAGTFAQAKNLAKTYDVILGLDKYQMAQVRSEDFKLSHKDFETSQFNISSLQNFYEKFGFEFDGAPLTFFLSVDRDNIQIESETLNFFKFEDFLSFLKTRSMRVAIPAPDTSVVGTLYLNWILENTANLKNFVNASPWVYVSSWTEAFGLFEQESVQGFLSYETSQIYFQKKNSDVKDSKKIVKVELQIGHPNYTEYALISQVTKTPKKTKYQFLKHLYSKDSQKSLLNKNYMWPVNYNSNLSKKYKTLKHLKLQNLKSKSELLKIWKSLR